MQILICKNKSNVADQGTVIYKKNLSGILIVFLNDPIYTLLFHWSLVSLKNKRITVLNNRLITNSVA